MTNVRKADRWARIGVSAAIVAVSVVGVLVLGAAERSAAASASSSSIDDFLVPAEGSGGARPARLTYETATTNGVLENGDSIPLAEDLAMTVRVDPYPPSTFDIDVELQLTDASGRPIDDARITGDYDMAFMWHGPFPSEYRYVSEGRYRVRLDLFMFGPWELAMRVDAPGHEWSGDLSLSIYVWPE